MTRLLKAAQRGTIVHVRRELCRRAAAIDQPDRRGNAPLHYAALRGQSAMVQLLLHARADVRLRNREGYSPLDLSVLEGHSRVVTLLLDAGSPVEGQRARGLSPLHLAAFAGHERIVALLLLRGADPHHRDEGRGGHTPLHYAAQEGHWRVVERLLESGARVNSTSGGFTPLALAVGSERAAAVRTLLVHGADPNIRCPQDDHDTPLHMACVWNDSDRVIRSLLRCGANPRLRSRDGKTPAETAEERGKTRFSALLRKAEPRQRPPRPTKPHAGRSNRLV
ncbi:MAG: ankyrin repeat domain-containing protein [Polyangiaceae bacterium]|nr:ankyrin repeat domain-containing protein [Polyangiaceae bacterium]